MSPARTAHDAPARRRRPPATHENEDDQDRSAEEEPQDSDPPEDEADPVDEPEEPPEDEAEEPPEGDADEQDQTSGPADDGPSDDVEPPPPGGLDAQEAARRAVEHLRDLTHHRPEGVVGIARDEDGWTVTVEVLEDAHVPSTSDVLAEYEVRLDGDGGLLGATRGRRYVRGRTER
jgi:hypothetical protein